MNVTLFARWDADLTVQARQVIHLFLRKRCGEGTIVLGTLLLLK